MSGFGMIITVANTQINERLNGNAPKSDLVFIKQTMREAVEEAYKLGRMEGRNDSR